METSPVSLVYIVAESVCQAETLVPELITNPRFGLRVFTSATACLPAVLTEPPTLIIIASDFEAAPPLVMAARRILRPAAVTVVMPTKHPIGIMAPQLLDAGAMALLPTHPQTGQHLTRLAQRLAAEQVVPSVAQPSNMLGASPVMRQVFALVRKAATSNITVSILGETGTGKEEVARAIHAASSRSGAPFVGLNMAAIPRELLESELFGHEKGAFTGATAARVGHFERADSGTLFLDEIADLDLGLQAKLLRVVQERTFTRVGDTRGRPLTARLIVASHTDLPQAVRAGMFREDLYYRLLGLPIQLPPLRDRGDDILLLATRFLNVFCPTGSGGPGRFSAAAERRLLEHPYPGNVRELRAIVELAAVLAEGEQIETEDIRFPPGHCSADALLPQAVNTRLTLRQHVVGIVQQYLKHYNGNVLAVASHLGVGKSTLYRMIQSGEVKTPE